MLCDDCPPEEAPIEEAAEEPGADEEVCLLPDTEREISEADKAAAERVLAEKRKQAEGNTATHHPQQACAARLCNTGAT